MGFVWGCQSDIPLSDRDSAVSPVPIDVTIALERSAAMPTVYVLSVESDEPTYLHTRFAQQEGAVRSLHSGLSRFHEHTIWGLKPEMETRIDIDVSNDERSIRTESWVETTGSLGAALPQFSLNTTSPNWTVDFYWHRSWVDTAGSPWWIEMVPQLVAGGVGRRTIGQPGVFEPGWNVHLVFQLRCVAF